MSRDRRTRLLDDLIGPQKDRLWNGEAERLGCIEIDNELKFGRLLHRQISRLGTLQYLVHERGGAPKQVRNIRPIGQEGTGFTGKSAGIKQYRYFRVCCEFRD